MFGQCKAPFTLEINFEILFRNLERVLFFSKFFFGKKFHLWSAVIGQSASVCKHQMKRRRMTMLFTYRFRKFISSVKVLSFKRKISKVFISK